MTTHTESTTAQAPLATKALALIDRIIGVGIDGAGPYASATAVADQHLLSADGDVERAVKRLVATHRRQVVASGFATGLGGLATLPVAIPADVTAFYIASARCAAAIAALRGYDLNSDEVRTVVLLSTLGSAGTSALSEAGVQITNKALVASLKKLPGSSLTKINQAVGFRLLTKFGTTGVVNLGKVVPFAGAGVGAAVNGVGMTAVGTYAKANFPPIDRAARGTAVHEDVIEAEMVDPTPAEPPATVRRSARPGR